MVFSINPTAEKTQAMFQGMAIAQNGTGSATPITGGQGAAPSSSPVTAPSNNSGGSGATPGQGTVGADGSCTCIASCSAGSFPAAVQGVGAFGGMGGKCSVSPFDRNWTNAH